MHSKTHMHPFFKVSPLLLLWPGLVTKFLCFALTGADPGLGLGGTAGGPESDLMGGGGAGGRIPFLAPDKVRVAVSGCDTGLLGGGRGGGKSGRGHNLC